MENYVDRAIQSVMDQTVDPSLYEVIAINDASTDDTLSHLNEWAAQYPDTVKVITYEENLRQGGARNLAIKQARGEYLCYLDADDWLEPDALATYEFAIKQDNYDLIATQSEENYSFGINYNKNTYTDLCIGREFSTSNKNEFIETDLGYVCTSIYRRSIVTDNSIWFPEHLAYEDIYWQRLIKFYVGTAATVEHVTLHHYIHDESTINKKNASHQTDRLTSYERYLEEIDKKGYLTTYYNEIMNDTMETYLFNSYFAFFINMDEIPDVYTRIRSTLYRYFPDWEKVYDDSNIPMIFQYMLKLLKKAKAASVADLQPFKEAVLESIDN